MMQKLPDDSEGWHWIVWFNNFLWLYIVKWNCVWKGHLELLNSLQIQHKFLNAEAIKCLMLETQVQGRQRLVLRRFQSQACAYSVTVNQTFRLPWCFYTICSTWIFENVFKQKPFTPQTTLGCLTCTILLRLFTEFNPISIQTDMNTYLAPCCLNAFAPHHYTLSFCVVSCPLILCSETGLHTFLSTTKKCDGHLPWNKRKSNSHWIWMRAIVGKL